MDEIPVSHRPGSMENLEEGDPRQTPIDNLLGLYTPGSWERAQFKYKGVWYVIANGYGDPEFYITLACGPTDYDNLIMEFDSFLDMLDTPCLPDGATVRQAWISISFDDFQII